MARPLKHGTGAVRLTALFPAEIAADLAAWAKAGGVPISDIIVSRCSGRNRAAVPVPAIQPTKDCAHSREKKLTYMVACADCGKRLR